MGGKSCFFIGHRETSEAIYPDGLAGDPRQTAHFLLVDSQPGPVFLQSVIQGHRPLLSVRSACQFDNYLCHLWMIPLTRKVVNMELKIFSHSVDRKNGSSLFA